MAARTSVGTKSTLKPYETGFITSRGGMKIGYRRLRNGPSLVVLHGSVSTGFNHIQLADALADAFTVYLPDRRGFCLSAPYADDFSVQGDVHDLDVLLGATSTQNVFGYSLAALSALKRH